ncbi:MAG: ATP-binding protein [Dehalococcoidia bacterium]|nr:ATP-binding protein [Dehalococcoidia bacterium]
MAGPPSWRNSEQALEDAVAGHGSAVAISGEPGIGKTSLITAFSSRTEGTGAFVLHGHCYEDDWAPRMHPS